MRKQLVALAGATVLSLGSALFSAPSVSADQAPAAPTAAHLDFIAKLAPMKANKVTGSGEIWVTLTGDSAKFTLQVSGLLAGAAHATDIYVGGSGKCPDASAIGTDGKASLSLTDSAPVLGTPRASLTTSGDTSIASALALTRYPTQSDYTYSRTFDVDPTVTAAVKNGTALVVVHGVDYNGNGRYDDGLGATAGNPPLPAEASHPALCGAFVPSQMVTVPKGSADTGGGSTAGQFPATLGLGFASLLAAIGAAAISFRRRHARPSEDQVVTNGFRRTIK